MLSEMTMSEYVHWQAVYSVEPFPEERADRRAAETIQAIVAPYVKNIPNIDELMPDWWGEHRAGRQTPEQIQQNMQLIVAASKARKKKHAS